MVDFIDKIKMFLSEKSPSFSDGPFQAGSGDGVSRLNSMKGCGVKVAILPRGKNTSLFPIITLTTEEPQCFGN